VGLPIAIDSSQDSSVGFFWFDIDSFFAKLVTAIGIPYKGLSFSFYINGKATRESSPRTKRKSILIFLVISHLNLSEMLI
jgi:hypothetical protein